MIKIAANSFYQLHVDVEPNLIYIDLYGFWGGRSNVPEYLDDCKKAASCVQPGFTILVDMTQIKTVSNEAALLHAEVQRIFIQAGLSQAAEVYRPQDPIVCHQLTCIKQSTGVYNQVKVFTDRITAENWLLQSPKEIKKSGILYSLKNWFK